MKTQQERDREYYINNTEACKEYSKQYRKNNHEKIKKYNKEYKLTHKEEIREYNKEYRIKNKETISRREKNRKRDRKSKNVSDLKYILKRRKNDKSFVIRQNVSCLIRFYLKQNNGSKNNSSVWSKLPYSPKELKEHLEKQFEPWMNWDNYGSASLVERTWQIDHIIPQSLLTYDSLEHPNFLECWKLENLRPLEAIENILKGNKVNV